MKRATVNQQANKEMKQYCIDHKLFSCEMCGGKWALSFAHRHKRRDYYDKPVSWLWDINQWMLLCIPCHDKIEYDKELTQTLFNNKRGEDLFNKKPPQDGREKAVSTE